MLNKMALAKTAPRKFEVIRFARGWLRMRYRCMIGRATQDSTQRKVGKQTAKMAREDTTKG